MSDVLFFNPTQLHIIATVIAGICYGFLALLCLNCFSLLLRSKHVYSKRMRRFLLAYVVGMFLLSTGGMIQEIITMNFDYLSDMGAPTPLGHGALTYDVAIPFITPVVVWGADGLLMWRCMILYQGIPRAGEWALKVVLAILSLIALGCGASSFDPALDDLLMLSTPVVNIILGGMLAGRIPYLQKHFSDLLGAELSRQSPYSKIAMMCVESSALIVVVSVACIITTVLPTSWFAFPYLLLPHICVISPVLIIYRVVQGRSIEVMTSDLSGGRVSTMNFANDVPATNEVASTSC